MLYPNLYHLTSGEDATAHRSLLSATVSTVKSLDGEPDPSILLKYLFVFIKGSALAGLSGLPMTFLNSVLASCGYFQYKIGLFALPPPIAACPSYSIFISITCSTGTFSNKYAATVGELFTKKVGVNLNTAALSYVSFQNFPRLFGLSFEDE